ncbi:efflux RND transporter permease subunit [Defluviimonas sp. WL0024]|uniref:Efflux RND transporter permease subunit n=2 Tax=Albidovulum TaxID=205889 RepID=A0ABT3J8P5_9RHOB|nr:MULTISPECIES: efflux RND transporter permease subunit [Defluviimonas]MCU9848867.1 efflux RND transporter permease subunit [Defluviimonas sp. WL0024]MCW3783759.1 efflux RND transporter permease subunit [Defluviimonas salinarum]
MKRFNLSDWALNHRSFVWFLMIVSLAAGVLAYVSIGREEDPDFSIKTMIISAALPGADTAETLRQVTDRIEKKLEDIDELDYTRSVTAPGRSIVYVELLPTTRPDEIPRIWQQVRNMMADIRPEFPAEFAGFQFNDSFGDVFGNLYAFTSDGFSPREVRDYVERIRRAVQALPDSGKVEIYGTRDEVIYLEFSTERLAALGLNQQAVQATLAAQNAILPSGVIDAGPEQVLVRIGGQFSGTESLEDINLRVGDRFFRLTDVANIRRTYEDPPAEIFRYEGQEAVGLAVGMKTGANILEFGAELDQVMAIAAAELPIGIEIHQVADQPHVVDEAVGHFLQALLEAVLIVLAVSFISLGMRAGFVVTLTIPLVLAITFVIMHYSGFTLQRISLGALIIALGLLVDDAMIAIETMIARLEKGDSLTSAASYAWTSIAFPMLTGTLVTVAGFIPVGLNDSAAGEFTFSLFVVIAVSLLVSWIVAVLFAPLLGVTFLPAKMAHHTGEPGRARRVFHRVLRQAMAHRWITIGLTVAVFGLSIWGMRYVEQQFFPNSDRPELIIDVALPQNAAISATAAEMDRIEAHLEGNENVLFWSSYVGRGAPRFLLAYDVPTPGPNTGQIVIQTPSVEARDALRAELNAIAARDFPGIDTFVKLLEIGPPVGRPVQYRISGPDIAVLRDQARDLAALVATDDRLANLVMDWNEPARVVRVEILQDKARQLGITPVDIAAALNAIYDGAGVTELRDAEYLVDILARGDERSRESVEALAGLQLSAANGLTIPLRAVATFRYETEQPVIHQRNRMPTITVKAAIATKDQPATIVAALAEKITAFDAALPFGYHVELGGAVAESAESQAPIAAVVPLMALIMLTLIMVQMQGFRLSFVVLCVAPLGLIGVVAALVPSGAPLGFVAILGVLALVGILIRNSIILVDEIEVLRGKGRPVWDAVFEASDARARPILLTAAAASLALIPISRQIFWGPMAYAMMGGIIAGTVITLVFVPALYLAVFRVRRPDGTR